MQTTKRYTNATFTKRIDHEGGAKRGAAKMPSPAICPKCDSVYSNGYWTARKQLSPEMKFRDWTPEEKVKCPACRQKEAGVAGGYVRLSGKFYRDHADEIENLISNEVERAGESNPLSVVIAKRENAGVMTIETSTEHLAERLGHALRKAYSGEVDFDFSHENKVVRVVWHRD